MHAFIAPPRRIPWYLRIGISIAARMAGRDLLPARLLAWYPKTAISSGVLEALIAHRDRDLDERILKLVRMQVSFAVSCPFCIDMNSFEFAKYGISHEEIRALQGRVELAAVPTLSAREQVALEYARLVSRTPLAFPAEFVARLRAQFSEREIVILASTAAQVNYWARLIQALGVPPAGFLDECELPPP